MAGVAGIEPTISRFKVWRIANYATPQIKLVSAGGFEPSMSLD